MVLGLARAGAGVAILATVASLPSLAVAQTAAPALDSGNAAWLMTATALVLFMTLPGLALFYGGLVRMQNVLSVLMHCVAIACLVSVVWLGAGYTLAFSDGGAANPWIGGLDKAFLATVGFQTLLGNVPESVFFMFQMTFAIITPALIVGAYVERIRFSAVLWFSALWLIIVYVPVCHWVWGGGWLAQMGALDFAGGLVVHTTAGVSALMIAQALGGRSGFPHEVKPPHSPGATMMGACMLWFGWFGFNAGSALAADGSAGMAMTVTHISAAMATLVWMAIEWLLHGKPSLVGAVTGTIAGLATITPASGFVGPVGALIIGASAGVVCYSAVTMIKARLRIDDSLDVFAVHGVGGMLGTLLTAVLATQAFGGKGLAPGQDWIGQLGVQALAILATAAWTFVASYIIIKLVGAMVGLRVSREAEIEGLDITSHGERGYTL